MKVRSAFMLSLALSLPTSHPRQALDAVPAPVRTILDQRHPGWRVPTASAELLAGVGSRLGSTPGVVAGDFDSDGRTDYALLVEYRNVDEPDKSFTHFVEALVFLNGAGGFRATRLRDRQPGPDAALFLTLQRRGTQGFNVETGSAFVYPHDSIGEWYFGKAAGGSYVYDGGLFRYVIEVD